MKNKQFFVGILITKVKRQWNDVIEHGKYFSKKFLPKSFQIELTRFFNNERYQLRINIIKYLYEYLKKKEDDEIAEILQYLKKNPLTNIPYNLTNKETGSISVYSDDKVNMKYVLFDDKRLYFPRGWKAHHVSGFYKNILKEQDINSPHRYEYGQFYVNKSDVVVDIGSSEGLFGLSIIDRAKVLYLFECDTAWIEALTETFRPWKDKVKIVNKYVSDIDTDKSITLDSYFKEECINFIKMDVEGAENEILAGAKNILSSSENLKIAICTYHRKNDYDDLKNILSAYGYNIDHSKGYIFHLGEKNLTPPYLRRCLIRCSRQQTI
jgi:hypothetical protein